MRPRRAPSPRRLPAAALLLVATAQGAGCSGASGGRGAPPPADRPAPPADRPAPPPANEPPTPFEPLPAHAAVQKVKQLLTGLPATDDELAAVLRDPAALRGHVDRWMATDAFRAKTIDFFKQAFQQTQTTLDDYVDQLGHPLTFEPSQRARFLRAVEESFARTAFRIVAEGRPFTEVVTTDRFELSPPLLSFYAYLDAVPFDDAGKPVASELWILKTWPKFQVELTTAEQIPLAETLDRASPNFMRWTAPLVPSLDPAKAADCGPTEVATARVALRTLQLFLFGARQRCPSFPGPFTAADWDAWRTVTIRPPRPGEERTLFWDLPRLRDPGVAELVATTPRVGFMTTPAFFANWPTNVSNSYRVTTNQALIVALGRSFDDRGTTVQLAESSDDRLHAAPGTVCYGCHQTLDPMREFFRGSYALGYHAQHAKGAPPQGIFTVDGSPPVGGGGIAAFARAVAAHPRFALAWAQKLCQHARSAPCAEDDPELVRIASAFRESGHDYRTLVRELFSSPLVTDAAPTATAARDGVAMSIARREALCAALEQRLGVRDACNLRGETAIANRAARTRATNLALAIPGAGYGRGEEAPLLPHDPNLFFHAATENLCNLLAAEVIDAGPAPRFSSKRADEAIAELVATVMGLAPRDPRAAGMRAILKDHHAEALAAGLAPRDALASTFVLACQSPVAIGLGL